jgi:hypothetical protein
MDSLANVPPKVFLLCGALIVLSIIFLRPKSIPENLKAKSLIKIVTLLVILIFVVIAVVLRN